MNKFKIKRWTAVLLVSFMLFLLALTAYFAITGNQNATFAAFTFNGFFAIVLFFLLRLHRYMTAKKELEDDDSK